MAAITYGFTWSQAVLDVALEDHTIALCESEGLVDRLQGVAIGHESREDGGVHRATVVVDDLEGALGVLGHGDTGAGKDAIGS